MPAQPSNLLQDLPAFVSAALSLLVSLRALEIRLETWSLRSWLHLATRWLQNKNGALSSLRIRRHCRSRGSRRRNPGPFVACGLGRKRKHVYQPLSGFPTTPFLPSARNSHGRSGKRCRPSRGSLFPATVARWRPRHRYLRSASLKRVHDRDRALQTETAQPRQRVEIVADTTALGDVGERAAGEHAVGGKQQTAGALDDRNAAGSVTRRVKDAQRIIAQIDARHVFQP